MTAYCGLCGQEEHQLVTHVRNVHEMEPEFCRASGGGERRNTY